MLFIWSLELIMKNWRHLWDPRTWITLFLFYFMGSLFILFFIEVPLDILLLFLVGKTFSGLFSIPLGWLSNYALSSLFSTVIFTLLLSGFVSRIMKLSSGFPLLRRDVMQSIVEYNSSYIFTKIKRTFLLFLVGVAIYLVFGL